MNKTLRFSVNGQSRTVTTDPNRPLLDVLREDLHLTGTKYGCGEGQCRGCTVLVDGQSIPSCLTQVGVIEGKSVLTIEGLAPPGKLHPVQEAFLAEGAFQCGYCTAGMILETVAFLTEVKDPTEVDVRNRMQRHLCRCCNYPKETKAILRAAKEWRR
jgi:aerobic carbon-monoxide dehydrogenase small subunit